MKIKKLCLLFNIVIFFSLFSIFFIPLSIVDISYLGDFWRQNWWLLCFLFLIIFIVNMIFILNWKIYQLLDSQNWVALAHYLEKKIRNTTFLSKKTAILYIESLFLIGDFSSISSFEGLLKIQKKALRLKLAPRFLASLVISSKIADARLLSDDFINSGKKIDDWVFFYRGFIENQAGDFEQASLFLEPLSINSSDPLISALSGFLLLKRILPSGCVNEEKIRSNIQSCKQRIVGKYTVLTWQKLLDDSRSNINSVVFSSMFNEVTEWLFLY